MPEAEVYSIFVFDCPVCGGQTMLDDADPSDVETCADCGEEVTMLK